MLLAKCNRFNRIIRSFGSICFSKWTKRINNVLCQQSDNISQINSGPEWYRWIFTPKWWRFETCPFFHLMKDFILIDHFNTCSCGTSESQKKNNEWDKRTRNERMSVMNIFVLDIDIRIGSCAESRMLSTNPLQVPSYRSLHRRSQLTYVCRRLNFLKFNFIK